MEVGSDIVTVSTGVEDQMVRRLIANCIEVVDDSFNGCRARRCNAHQRWIRHLALQLERLLPDVELSVRPQRHQYYRVRRFKETSDVGGLKKEVDRYCRANGLSCPKDGVRLGERRQHERHAGSHTAETRQQVGGQANSSPQISSVIAGGHQSVSMTPGRRYSRDVPEKVQNRKPWSLRS
jgi:hypothetical protein